MFHVLEQLFIVVYQWARSSIQRIAVFCDQQRDECSSMYDLMFRACPRNPTGNGQVPSQSLKCAMRMFQAQN
jgi:hypothetical protein